MNCAVKLVVLAVLATVVVVLVAPSVDLPDSTEIGRGIVNGITAHDDQQVNFPGSHVGD